MHIQNFPLGVHIDYFSFLQNTSCMGVDKTRFSLSAFRAVHKDVGQLANVFILFYFIFIIFFILELEEIILQDILRV